MKRTFTLLAAMVLTATCIFAQEHSLKRTNAISGGFSKHRFGIPGKNPEQNLFQGKNSISNQADHQKSAMAVKQKLDEFSGEEWDAINGQWMPDYKSVIIYDANFNVLKFLDYFWDSNSNHWISDGSEEYSYDANGNITQSLYTYFDEETNQIVIAEKYVYSYDGQGNETQEILYENDASNLLVATSKYEYTYDAGGKRTQGIRYGLDEITNQLVAIQKENFTYNSNGMEILMILSDMLVSTWVQYQKYESTYNSNGNKTLYTFSDWDYNYNKWGDPSEKYEYSYNASGNLIQEFQYMKGSNSQWEAYSKDEYVFDANGNNTQHTSYYGWDQTTGKWTEVWKEEYAFNNTYSFDDLILPFDDYDEIFTHMLTEIKDYSWNLNTLTWELGYKTTLRYSEQNYTSVSQRGKDIVSVYPNPFAESVSISLPASNSKIIFDLFDQQGRKLMTRLISSDQKVSLQGLNKGMYVYRLNVDGKIQSGKLVKE
jgi:hypothetical protein